MKKTIYIILILLLLLPIGIKASSFNTSLGSNKTIYAGDQFTINFSASNGTNIMGIRGLLTYDSSKLSIVSSAGLNGFNLTLGTNVVVDGPGISGTFGFASITFRATSNFVVGQSTSISLSNVTGSDGTSDLTGSGSSVAITMVVPKSTNNNLSSLTINNNLVSGFSSSKTSYSMTVNNNVSSVNISATSEDNKSYISGTGTKNLNVYSNAFNIVVTAENGSKKTYYVTIIRKDPNGLLAPLSTNNLLSSITITGYTLEFNSDTTNYSLTVENNISSLVVTATAADSKSKVEVGNTSNLKIGDNIVNITVTAENGDKKVYTLVIKRKSEGPTTTINELLNVIGGTTSSTINIDINDNNTTLSNDILKAIKNSHKKIVVSYYQNNIITYKWELNGSNVSDYKAINTLITYNIADKDKIDKLTNYADNLYLNFAYTGILPKDTYISINVASKYANGSKVKLYFYDASKGSIRKVYDNLVVENGYLKFKLDHCSAYIISMAEFNKKDNVLIYKIIIAVLGFTIVCMLSSKLYLYRKDKKIVANTEKCDNILL